MTKLSDMDTYLLQFFEYFRFGICDMDPITLECQENGLHIFDFMMNEHHIACTFQNYNTNGNRTGTISHIMEDMHYKLEVCIKTTNFVTVSIYLMKML